jgi:hypothetical protein
MTAWPIYYTWDKLGRPLTPCRPVLEMVAGLKLYAPAAAGVLGWWADEAHYQADPPEDHCPYSSTGWPLTSPQWWVFATDVMHRPDLGLDCEVLAGYWLAEARAGRMPWLKYLNWREQRFDVRNAWRPVSTSGHNDHIHLSVRTDHLNTSLAGWSITPEADMTPEQATQLAEVHLLLTEGKRLGPAQTSDGGIPIPWIVRKFWEVGNTDTAQTQLLTAIAAAEDSTAIAAAIADHLGPDVAADVAANLRDRLAA